MTAHSRQPSLLPSPESRESCPLIFSPQYDSKDNKSDSSRVDVEDFQVHIQGTAEGILLEQSLKFLPIASSSSTSYLQPCRHSRTRKVAPEEKEHKDDARNSQVWLDLESSGIVKQRATSTIHEFCCLVVITRQCNRLR